MKLNLPPRTSRTGPLHPAPGRPPSTLSQPEPAIVPKTSFFRSADEAAQRKQAILAQLEHRRMLAKAALHAGRLGRQSSHL